MKFEFKKLPLPSASPSSEGEKRGTSLGGAMKIFCSIKFHIFKPTLFDHPLDKGDSIFSSLKY
jgi:hypothetical protein